MTRKEFKQRFSDGREGRAGNLHEDAEVAAEIAEAAGVAWDQEEPEVLWESGPYRIIAPGECQINSIGNRRPDWKIQAEPHPAMIELARLLVEERKQQEALDEHNDELEGHQVSVDDPEYARRSAEIARETARMFGSALGPLAEDGSLRSSVGECHSRLNAHLARLDEHGDRLTRVEEDLLLVRGQAAHVDEKEEGGQAATAGHLAALEERIEALEVRPMLGKAGDLQGGRAPVFMHYEEWKKLVAVYELWGPDGTLRERLASARPYSALDSRVVPAAAYDALRSELLALPDEVKP